MSSATVRALHTMIGSEESRELHKAKMKAKAKLSLDGGQAMQALDPRTGGGLKGVVSAKNIQALLAKPKPVAPTVIAPPTTTTVRPALITNSSASSKKKSKHSVTLNEDEVMFSADFDAQPPTTTKPKVKKQPAQTQNIPTIIDEPPAAESSTTSSQSLKKLKHRNFRGNSNSTNNASSTIAAEPAAPLDPFAPAARALTKAEKKKLEKLAIARKKKQEKKETLALLHQSQMTPEQHKLLISSTHIGQKVTLKQQRRRQFVEQKAGIAPVEEDDDPTVSERKIPLHSVIPPPKKLLPLDFFASTISPHIHPPKPKPAIAPENLPAAKVAFADDFGSFRSSASSTTKKAGEGEDDGLVGRGYVAGYIKTGKNSMQELEREMKEREEDEDDDEDDDEEDGEDEEGEDEDGEDDDEEDDEDEEDDDAPSAASSNIYSVAFDVKPIRANKKKRKRIALVIPGQEQPKEEEEEEEQEEDAEMEEEDNGEEVEADGEDEDQDEMMEDDEDENGEDEEEAEEEEEEAQDERPSKKSKKPASVEDEDEPTPAGPKLSRKAAKAANASVVIATKFDAGKKFSRIKNDGPSALYQELLSARKEVGGTIAPYPGTEVLSEFRVSNNDLFLGDKEEGKAIDKNKKKSKAAYEAATAPKSSIPLPPPAYRMPTLRTTPSGHLIVEVYRTEEIQAARMQLPLCSQEQEVMEAITENDILIISGETGSGKTTQVPQFLFEAGYSLLETNKPGLIGITEPRRVAAISTAKRVAEELNVWNPEESKKMRKKLEQQKEKKKATTEADAATTGEDADPDVDMTLVSYQIRYTRLSTASTRIKFMTDGILLREIQGNLLLPGYSVIIVDEAHERGINTDILIGLLSKIVPLRNKMAKKFLAEKFRREEELVKQGGKKEDVDLSDLTPTYPLKLIIMSATLRLHDFTENRILFPNPPPVISVNARQYPVTTHFHKFTPLKDYMDHTLKMIMKMHVKLPRGADNSGGILVFMTGKDEIDQLVKQLRTLFDEKRRREEAKKIRLTEALNDAMEVDGESSTVTSKTNSKKSRSAISLTTPSAPAPTPSYDENDPNDPIFDIVISDDEEDEVAESKDSEGATSLIKSKKSSSSKKSLESSDRFAEMEDVDENVADVADAEDATGSGGGGDLTDIGDSKVPKLDPALLQSQLRELADAATAPAYVLPLYSMLPTVEQMKVFQPPPSRDHRLIVIATNVAETSLTIPGIKYVLDVGREKSRTYDRVTGTSQYVVQWISKASAAQRSGRSGRTGPGHAYRLYSSAVFDTQFSTFAPPEILRNPLEGTILQLLAMNITNILTFPFPTPPDEKALRLAFRSLELLGAVENANPKSLTSHEKKITEFGRILTLFPVSPRFGKMLVLACDADTEKKKKKKNSNESSLLSYMIRVVACLSVEQLFLVPSFNKDDEKDEVEEEGEEDLDSKKSRSLDPVASLARQQAREIAARKKAAKQQKQRAYDQAQAQWRKAESSSDVMVMLTALGGYEHKQFQESKVEKKLAAHRCLQFLQTNFFRIKAVEEIQALKKQLQKIATEIVQWNVEQVTSESSTSVKQLDPSTSPEEQDDTASSTAIVPANASPAVQPYLQLLASLNSTTPLPPPTEAQEDRLTQILCAGFIDHVARRMPQERKVALTEAWNARIKTDEEEAEGFNLDGAYECIATSEPVFIHPSSILFPPEAQPDYLVYAELVKTRKLYMRGNTALPHISWLVDFGAHLVTYSAPFQSNPSPIYDPVADDILAYRDASFGPNHWPLPRAKTPCPPGTDRIKHFLRLFLSGVVCQQLKPFLPYLLYKPDTITNHDPTVALNKTFTRLITVFVKEQIDTKAKLVAQWKKDPQFFLAEYLSWIQPSQQTQVKKIWPPLPAA